MLSLRYFIHTMLNSALPETISIGISHTEVEKNFALVSQILNTGFLLSFLPVVVMFGLVLVIKEEFNNLCCEISDCVDSNEIYVCDKLCSIMKKFHLIADTVSIVDKSHEFYIFSCVLTLSYQMAFSIYYQAIQCYDVGVQLSELGWCFMALFLLCISGHRISQSVSGTDQNTNLSQWVQADLASRKSPLPFLIFVVNAEITPWTRSHDRCSFWFCPFARTETVIVISLKRLVVFSGGTG